MLIGEAHFLQDDPVQIEGESYRLIDMISYFSDPTREEFLMTSPYFIPVGRALEDLQEGDDRGVKVKIITNSLASNDVLAAHAGHAEFRVALLEAGVEIHEMRDDAGAVPTADRPADETSRTLQAARPEPPADREVMGEEKTMG